MSSCASSIDILIITRVILMCCHIYCCSLNICRTNPVISIEIGSSWTCRFTMLTNKKLVWKCFVHLYSTDNRQGAFWAHKMLSLNERYRFDALCWVLRFDYNYYCSQKCLWAKSSNFSLNLNLLFCVSTRVFIMALSWTCRYPAWQRCLVWKQLAYNH